MSGKILACILAEVRLGTGTESRGSAASNGEDGRGYLEPIYHGLIYI